MNAGHVLGVLTDIVLLASFAVLCVLIGAEGRRRGYRGSRAERIERPRSAGASSNREGGR